MAQYGGAVGAARWRGWHAKVVRLERQGGAVGVVWWCGVGRSCGLALANEAGDEHHRYFSCCCLHGRVWQGKDHSR